MHSIPLLSVRRCDDATYLHACGHPSGHQRPYASTGRITGHQPHTQQHISSEPATWHASAQRSRRCAQVPRLEPQPTHRESRELSTRATNASLTFINVCSGQWRFSASISQQVHSDYRRRRALREPIRRTAYHAHRKSQISLSPQSFRIEQECMHGSQKRASQYNMPLARILSCSWMMWVRRP